jgi:hypothetical protein
MTIIALLTLLTAAQTFPEFPKEKVETLHSLIKPQGDEFAWYDGIPWLLSVQEAREKAARENKPIVVWCSADGQPCGAT